MLNIPEDLLTGLKQRYGEAQRHYHTWDHIDALLRHYEALKDQLHDPDAVKLALYWHDAIYDPMSAENEFKSADLLLDQCAGLIGTERLTFAAEIIRATKAHLMPDGLMPDQASDLALFLDIDLSILAARPDVFDTYEINIRKEFAFAPEEVYKAGRAAVLKSFLDRDRLYFSDHFFGLWENEARQNLKRSIAQLSVEGE